jgi:hypothetical protein
MSRIYVDVASMLFIYFVIVIQSLNKGVIGFTTRLFCHFTVMYLFLERPDLRVLLMALGPTL